MRYDAADSFDDTLGKVVATTRAHKESLWGGNLYGGMELPYRISRGIWRTYRGVFGKSGTMPPVVMNIGVLDEGRLSFGGSHRWPRTSWDPSDALRGSALP